MSLSRLERDLSNGGSDEGDAYRQLSSLCVICPEADRLGLLSRLGQAKSPWAQAVAAIYLFQAVPTEGRVALEQATQLPGEPGRLAALALVRRGHAAYAPRLLRVEEGNYSSEASIWTRTLALLSNAAARAKVVFPWTLGGETRATPKTLAAWWEKNQIQLTPQLRDPWLKELGSQFVE